EVKMRVGAKRSGFLDGVVEQDQTQSEEQDGEGNQEAGPVRCLDDLRAGTRIAAAVLLTVARTTGTCRGNRISGSITSRARACAAIAAHSVPTPANPMVPSSNASVILGRSTLSPNSATNAGSATTSTANIAATVAVTLARYSAERSTGASNTPSRVLRSRSRATARTRLSTREKVNVPHSTQ